MLPLDDIPVTVLPDPESLKTQQDEDKAKLKVNWSESGSDQADADIANDDDSGGEARIQIDDKNGME